MLNRVVNRGEASILGDGNCMQYGLHIVLFDMQGGTDGDPFAKFPAVVKSISTFFELSPLSTKRKMNRLSPGHIKEIVDNMYLGGMSMLQGRFLFAHISLTGMRRTHFLYLVWGSVRLSKTTIFYKNGVRTA